MPDGEALFEHYAEKVILKTRYRVPWKGLVWDVDEFKGGNQGLIVAEVELKDERQAVELPPWIAGEVTGQEQYLNANLARRTHE